MIFLQLTGIFLAVEVEDHVIHRLAEVGIIGQHLVAESCGRAVRQFFPHTLEKGFSIGKALSIGDVNKVVPIDKSSAVLTVLLAIILFKETNHLAVKLIGTALLAVGVFLMIEKKNSGAKNERSAWLPYAIGSALFAALTSILAKVGISNVESNLGTAIRTGVVLVMAWLIVFMKGKQSQVKSIDKTELVFIALSGLATGGSWLCYYYAIQNGIVSVVVPIDKLSILISIGFSYFVFKEKLTKKAFAGLLLMVCGTLAMAIWA